MVIPCHRPKNSSDITPFQLTLIAPLTSACNISAPFTDECRTAEQAAPFINKAFNDYAIASVGEKAAILSLMLFETGDFKFDRNHFPAPGRPGQGTRNLMTFPFVHQYALDTPSTHSRALALAGTNANDPSITNDTMNAVRDLVLGDELSFASAMWFYKVSGPERVGCTVNQTLVDGLTAQTRQGWENYITGCIFTSVTEDRTAVWEKTVSVLSL
ncbi:hypothetical protein BDN71DRAFT_1398133 [Pleurotus eryngii]|uniref:Uncharacterized protein n=1 Tax=Pleurotus eryngii TaxID=5323 RepID=A0A9P5ZPI1_PLEER|nr:hypothetical protein BDN71DRAFT_1398133 [Pleurotus eryngii]